MDGIFFDEGWNDCGPDNKYSELYKLITQDTKSRYPGAITVLNPGATMPQCFEDSADTLMTFESNYSMYVNNYVSNGWTPKDSRKIWHIIYDVPADQAAAVAALAVERGVGLIEITNDILPNPYDTLPSADYMNQVFAAVPGGKPLDIGIFPTSGSGGATSPSLSVVGSEYTSITLSWSAASNVVGYRIYVDSSSTHAIYVPASMTRVTIGGFEPDGTSHSFTVRGMAADGSLSSPASNTVSSGTKSLASKGKYITDVSFAGGTDVLRVQANVLVPYAFVRVYLWTWDCYGDQGWGWPINYDLYDYVCTHFMVEGSNLYRYSGDIHSGITTIPWAWTQIGEVQVDQIGYTYKWTIPGSNLKGIPANITIQAQGYSPRVDVFSPCPIAATEVSGDRYCV